MISYAASILSASSRPDSIIFLASACSRAQSTVPAVLGDRVPVHVVPPCDLSDVRPRAGPSVDVQLSHYVALHILLLPGRIPDWSVVPLAQLEKYVSGVAESALAHSARRVCESGCF